MIVDCLHEIIKKIAYLNNTLFDWIRNEGSCLLFMVNEWRVIMDLNGLDIVWSRDKDMFRLPIR